MRLNLGVRLPDSQVQFLMFLVAFNVFLVHGREFAIAAGIDVPDNTPSGRRRELSISTEDLQDTGSGNKVEIVNEIQESLGPDYIVVLSATRIDIEYAPPGP